MMDNFANEYIDNITNILDGLKGKKFAEIVNKLMLVYEHNKTIFLIGNGGSAATASHFAADFGKNAIPEERTPPRIISLCDNISFVTAIGNDLGYENIFSVQLKNLLTEDDLLIALSASGNSPNIIKAVEYAKTKNVTVIGISGFDGGKLKKLSDININITADSYEQIEDVHLIIMHIIVYYFKKAFKGGA